MVSLPVRPFQWWVTTLHTEVRDTSESEVIRWGYLFIECIVKFFHFDFSLGFLLDYLIFFSWKAAEANWVCSLNSGRRITALNELLHPGIELENVRITCSHISRKCLFYFSGSYSFIPQKLMPYIPFNSFTPAFLPPPSLPFLQTFLNTILKPYVESCWIFFPFLLNRQAWRSFACTKTWKWGPRILPLTTSIWTHF